MTAPLVYVVDASVALQGVSPEPLTTQATTLSVLLADGEASVLAFADLLRSICNNRWTIHNRKLS